jgi:hypothetical protein
MAAASCSWHSSWAGVSVSSFILCSVPVSISKHRTLNHYRMYKKLNYLLLWQRSAMDVGLLRQFLPSFEESSSHTLNLDVVVTC